MSNAPPTIIRREASLLGWHRDGRVMERATGEFIETFLLMPGTGVYFLVSRERVEPVKREGGR